MEVSKAALLEGMDVDDSLQFFHTAAIATVQNLAATFTALGSSLSKEMGETRAFKQAVSQKLDALTMSVETASGQFDELSLTVAKANDRWNVKIFELAEAQQRDQASLGETVSRCGSLEERLAPLEQRLSRFDQLAQRLQDIEAYIASDDQDSYRRMRSRRARQGQAQEGEEKAKYGAEQDSWSLSPSASPRGGNESRDLDLGDGGLWGVPTDSARQLRDSMNEQRRITVKLENTSSQLNERVNELTQTLANVRDTHEAELRRHDSDLSSTLRNLAELAREVEAQHSVLNHRIENFKQEFEAAINSNTNSLMSVEKVLERKADVRLVLDKVSRSEYASQIRRLQAADDELAGRAVAREEYKSQMLQLRDSMKEDMAQRQVNIGRIANELHRLVSDINNKASKQDLLHIANVLNSMPKVTDEIDNLKTFVNSELSTKTDKILSRTVDRRAVNKLFDRKLKALQEEVQQAAQSSDCDACAKRSGVHNGTFCLSCATPLKLLYSRELLSARGGGFVVQQQPRRRDESKSTGSILGIGKPFVPPNPMSMSTENPVGLSNSLPSAERGSASLPPSSGGDQSYNSISVGSSAATPSTVGIVLPGSTTGGHSNTTMRMEQGADGRIYNTMGSRTHRLMVNPRPPGDRGERDRDSRSAGALTDRSERGSKRVKPWVVRET